MGWPSFLSELSFWANVGSVAGAVFTFLAFLYQMSLRKRYALLIQGPELIEELAEIGSQLEQLSSQERKTVLGKTRSLLASTSKHLRWRQRVVLWPTRLSLWWNWRGAPPETVENYYAEVQRVSSDLDIRIRNRQVEQ